MTNFEKIKQMSVEEFADWLAKVEDRCTLCAYCKGYCLDIDCVDGILEFLKSEVPNESNIKNA